MTSDPKRRSDSVLRSAACLPARRWPIITFTGISLGLPDPVPESLVMHAKLGCQLADHGLRVRLAIQTHGTRA
jgi:hypothetical protein